MYSDTHATRSHEDPLRLDAVYVVVHDMRSARELYSTIFDRSPVIAEERFSWFDLGGAMFGLLNAEFFGEPVDERPLVFGNNCVANIRSTSLEELHRRLEAFAPIEVTGIQEVGEYRLFQIQDPDRNRVEFYEVSG